MGRQLVAPETQPKPSLDDCGLTIHDMEALYCGNLGQASGMVGQRILQQIGQTGIPVVNVANACATGATAFREGWIAIKAGLYDTVLAVGVVCTLLFAERTAGRSLEDITGAVAIRQAAPDATHMAGRIPLTKEEAACAQAALDTARALYDATPLAIAERMRHAADDILKLRIDE